MTESPTTANPRSGMISFDVFHPDLIQGRNMIEASAGTGKTYSIALIFLRLLLEAQLTVDQILAVTFTNAATEEMKDRIRRFIRDAISLLSGKPLNLPQIQQIIDQALALRATKTGRDRESLVPLLLAELERALLSFDEANVFTIHSFCQRVISENAFESQARFDVELLRDDSDIVKEAVEDYFRVHFYEVHPVMAAYFVQKGIVPDSFLSILRGGGGNPFTTIKYLRNLGAIEVLDSRIANFEAAFLQLQTHWQQHRGDILGMLLQQVKSKVFSRVQAGWVQSSAKKLSNYLNTEIVSLYSDLDDFKYFSKHSQETLVKAGQTLEYHPFFEEMDIFRTITENLRESLDAYFTLRLKELFDYVEAQTKIKKDKANLFSFDDMILTVFNTLYSNDGAALRRVLEKKYRAVLIDEFQDTDAIQYTIFRRLFDGDKTTLFLIGDPKQAIYSFRGADIFAYLNAKDDRNRNASRLFTMDTNYRTAKPLVDAVNFLFQNRSEAFIFNDIHMSAVKAARSEASDCLTINKHPVEPLQVRYWPDLIAGTTFRPMLAKWVTDEILFLLEPSNRVEIAGRPIHARDITILTRSRVEARMVKQALNQYSIPAVLSKADNVFNTAEAIELYHVLLCLEDPGNTARVRGALLTNLLGQDIPGLEVLIRDEEQWEHWVQSFYSFHHRWNKKGFLPMFRQFLEEMTVMENLLRFTDGERRLSNVEQLAEILHQESLDRNLKMPALIAFFSNQLTAQMTNDEAYELRMETDADAVQIMTVHRSKGLEFPVVFCPFLWNNGKLDFSTIARYHPRKENHTIDRDTLVLDLFPEQYAKDYATEEILAENIRLMYVALTRAKYQCYIYWAPVKTGRTKGLATSAVSYLLAGIKEPVTKPDLESIKQAVFALANQPEVAVKQLALPEGLTPMENPPLDPETFVCRTQTRSLPRGFSISSFSSLSQFKSDHASRELPDHDAALTADSDKDAGNDVSISISIFTLPRGARIGSALHEILERIDFSVTDHGDVIRDVLEKYRMRPEDSGPDWEPVLLKMCNDLLSSPFPGIDSFCLNQLERKDRLVEMEFYFPLKEIEIVKLYSLLSETPVAKDQFPLISGYLKGFIDLTFRVNGKYYILDWKSNHLGNQPGSYYRPQLEQSINEHLYHLQYHIYTVALVQYLNHRMNGQFDYDTHFGGVYYVFLRGLDQTDPEIPGIYFDRPEKAVIDQWTNYLIRRGQ